MQTKFDRVSSTLANLKVEISEADYAAAVNKKLKEYAKTAQIKGFRPGHVPVGYIKKIYGKSVLVDEVFHVASHALNDVITENKLNIVGEPKIINETGGIDWSSQKDFEFDYQIGFASDFEVDLGKPLNVVKYEIEPEQKQIDDALLELKNRFGSDEEPETSEANDVVFGELTQESSEFFFQSAIPTDKLKEAAQKQFIGLKKDDVLTFDIQSLFDDAKELAYVTGKSEDEAGNLNGEFSFKVVRNSRPRPAEMNQEFFDKVFGAGKVSDEVGFMDLLKSTIKENYSRETEMLFGFQIEKSLVNQIGIELPEEFLKDFLLDVNKEKLSAEDIEKELPQILESTKMDLIRSRIAKDNDIKVEYPDLLDEVKAEISNYFGGQSFDGMDEFVSNMAEKQLKEFNQETINRYFNRALARKTLDFAKTRITPENKQVNVQEFTDLANEIYGK